MPECLVSFLFLKAFSFYALQGVMPSRRIICQKISPVRAAFILVALHPSNIASALVEGNSDVSKGLEWIRTWALHVAESDRDRNCNTVRMAHSTHS